MSDKGQKKMWIITAVIFIVMWLAGEVLFRTVLPQYRFRLYPAVPAMFLIFYFLTTSIVARADRKETNVTGMSRKVYNNFMIAKMVKLGLCFAVIILYKMMEWENFKAFLFTFMIFYLISLVLETKTLSDDPAKQNKTSEFPE